MNNLIELIKSFALGFAVLFAILVVIAMLALWAMHSSGSFLIIVCSVSGAAACTAIGDIIRNG